MKRRRVGCLAFGVCWASLFLFTNFGLALGDPVDPNGTNPLTVLFWVEIVVFVVGAILFFRAEVRDPEV